MRPPLKICPPPVVMAVIPIGEFPCKESPPLLSVAGENEGSALPLSRTLPSVMYPYTEGEVCLPKVNAIPVPS